MPASPALMPFCWSNPTARWGRAALARDRERVGGRVIEHHVAARHGGKIHRPVGRGVQHRVLVDVVLVNASVAGVDAVRLAKSTRSMVWIGPATRLAARMA